VTSFIVRIVRSEEIEFAVEAADATEAENNFLAGDEVASRTIGITVIAVEEVN
jgi:hypothetical protein